MSILLQRVSAVRVMILAFLLPLVCPVAQARIGESRRVCDRRYGEPVRVPEGAAMAVYRSRGVSIVVHFDAGLADMLSFHKLPSSDGTPASPFTEREISDLLAANGGERVWVAAAGTPERKEWRTEDGELGALLLRSTGYLVVYTSAFARDAAQEGGAESSLWRRPSEV